MLYDVVIIGGGAAGLCCAVTAKRRDPSLNIVILEKLDRVGKKLITTGNGRCNITNKNIDISRYHGGDKKFIHTVFKKHCLKDTLDFFTSIGVEIVFENDGRAYPASYQASSVVDALRFTVEELGIKVVCNCSVVDIKFEKNFVIKTKDRMFTAKKTVLAAGLLSGGVKLGCDGSVLEILHKHGFKTVRTTPAIVQVKTQTDVTKQLKGIKTECAVTVISNGKPVKTDSGEVLFTDYGLSGPPVLQLSRYCTADRVISLDLVPYLNDEKLLELLYTRKNTLSKRTAENFLTGFLNKRVGQIIVKNCGVRLSDEIGRIPKTAISEICYMIKNLKFRVIGNTGFINSQVTCGGVSVDEFTPLDMQSKRVPGLFIAGELIDVDGDCGGFNLQWAWSSAMTAADGVCAEVK